MARRSKPTGLPIINPRAGAIDIGSRFPVVAVPPDAADEPIQTFQAFTGELHRMAQWLKTTGVTTVAMESTGVYWVPVYEVLESAGIEVVVANARDARSGARSQERRQRRAVAAAPACLRLAAPELPSGSRDRHATCLPAHSRTTSGIRRRAHPARAEGPHVHEPAAAPRSRRCDRRDWPEDRSRHHRRRT